MNFKEAEALGVNVTLDRVPTTRVWDMAYTVCLDYPEEEHRKVAKSGLVIYTDGSHLGEKAGFGVNFTLNDITIKEKMGSISSYSTVEQTEIMAITMAADAAMDMRETGDHILILTDSKLALRKLHKGTHEELLALRCHKRLTALSKGRRVTVGWIKGHSGNSGHDRADFLAREGAQSSSTTEMPMNSVAAKKLASNTTRSTWTAQWCADTTCRQTKLWLPQPNTAYFKNIMKHDRATISLLVQAVTGHNHLNYHQYVCGKRADPLCRFCNKGTETFHHVATECQVLREEVEGATKPDAGEMERLQSALSIERIREAMRPRTGQEDPAAPRGQEEPIERQNIAQ